MLRKTLNRFFVFWTSLLDKFYGDPLSIDHPVAGGTISVYLGLALAALLALKMQQSVFVWLPAALLAAFANWIFAFPLFVVFVWDGLSRASRALWDAVELYEENSKLAGILRFSAFLVCALLILYLSFRIASLIACDLGSVSTPWKYLAWPVALFVGSGSCIILSFICWAIIDSIGMQAVAGISAVILLYFLKGCSTRLLDWLGIAPQCLAVFLLAEFVLYSCYLFPLFFLAISRKCRS